MYQDWLYTIFLERLIQINFTADSLEAAVPTFKMLSFPESLFERIYNLYYMYTNLLTLLSTPNSYNIFLTDTRTPEEIWNSCINSVLNVRLLPDTNWIATFYYLKNLE